MMRTLALLFVAGGCGTLLRAWLATFVASNAPPSFPWPTFVVNAVGCMACGVAFGLFERFELLGTEWRTLIFVGVLGALTTFSAFALDTVLLLRDGRVFTAVLSITANNVLGVLGLGAGLVAVRVCT